MPLEGSENWSAEIKEAARAAAAFYRDLLDQGLPEDVARDFGKAFIQSYWAKQAFREDGEKDNWNTG